MVIAIGLMSGTSLDGIDAAVVETDGRDVVSPIASLTVPMPELLKESIRKLVHDQGDVRAIEQSLTDLHATAVEEVLAKAELIPDNVDVVGFHGQTILHRPDQRRTWQIGNGSYLASKTGIDVVNDFRSQDMAAGGEGAPLVPVFHRALVAEAQKPVAVVNIGGIANVTLVGTKEESLLAFDTGPGNMLIDDWMARHNKGAYDEDGEAASHGTVNEATVESYLSDPYFSAVPPKSLDRTDFVIDKALSLSLIDGAATLTMLTARSIAAAAEFFDEQPSAWYICGGGRHNRTLMQFLQDCIDQPVLVIEDLGWDGDSIEAQAFAYLAVRNKLGLPLTFPGTTGVGQPQIGGVFCPA